MICSFSNLKIIKNVFDQFAWKMGQMPIPLTLSLSRMNWNCNTIKLIFLVVVDVEQMHSISHAYNSENNQFNTMDKLMSVPVVTMRLCDSSTQQKFTYTFVCYFYSSLLIIVVCMVIFQTCINCNCETRNGQATNGPTTGCWIRTHETKQ